MTERKRERNEKRESLKIDEGLAFTNNKKSERRKEDHRDQASYTISCEKQ